jgi:hypothetical protein
VGDGSLDVDDEAPGGPAVAGRGDQGSGAMYRQEFDGGEPTVARVRGLTIR